MRAYTVAGPSEAGTGPKTALTLIGSASVRVKLYSAEFGWATAPADQYGLVRIARFTAAGTSAASAPTPTPIDPGDVACIATAGWTLSAEPTYTAGAIALDIPVNQRNSWKWYQDYGNEFVAPASSANGIGIKNHSSSASMTLHATLSFRE